MILWSNKEEKRKENETDTKRMSCRHTYLTEGILDKTDWGGVGWGHCDLALLANKTKCLA